MLSSVQPFIVTILVASVFCYIPQLVESDYRNIIDRLNGVNYDKLMMTCRGKDECIKKFASDYITNYATTRKHKEEQTAECYAKRDYDSLTFNAILVVLLTISICYIAIRKNKEYCEKLVEYQKSKVTIKHVDDVKKRLETKVKEESA